MKNLLKTVLFLLFIKLTWSKEQDVTKPFSALEKDTPDATHSDPEEQFYSTRKKKICKNLRY